MFCFFMQGERPRIPLFGSSIGNIIYKLFQEVKMNISDNKLDQLVLSAIQAMEAMDVDGLKPRAISISSFLKGAESSPFYEVYKRFPKICGSVKASPKRVKEACQRLIESKKIIENNSSGRGYYTVYSDTTTFLSNCSAAELSLIEIVKKYLQKKIKNLKISDKTSRYTFLDSDKISGDGIEYAWMWFTRIDGALVFRYKFNQNDTDRTVYEKNNITVNDFQLQTIYNIVDFIVK